MSTRNNIMVIDRKHSSGFEEGFAIHPDVVADKAYINMYMHHDGYPEWQGVQLANWCKANARQDGSAIAAKLVHDHYYDSCYLYADHQHIDHQYTYIIWTGKPDIWISCYNQYNNTNVFCYTPQQVIDKYTDNMDYTDFANGKTRLMKCEDPNFTS